jgi:succinate dehydrogenase/fumarate reductase flavoprotein subunit
VLVIGSGAAGQRAAISARQKGVRVLVLSKSSPGRRTSTILSGGVFAGTSDGASTEDHLRRTLQAGRGINRQDLVEVLVTEAPARLKELVAWGMRAEFDDGYLFAKGRAPVWGEAIIRCLIERNKALGTEFLPEMVVSRLEMKNGAGDALMLSTDSGHWSTIHAGAVVLATGGAGALYFRHDNPRDMLGQGYVLALEAGAVLQDMEFVQFYPITLAEAGRPRYLVPPRLADKGKLCNDAGEDIYEKYGITERPAAERSRDTLSRALFREIYCEGRSVLLDLTSVSESDWRSDPFSASTLGIIGRRCGGLSKALRIAPAAHFMMGGVCIDADGSTCVPGLYAAGEAAGGLHGANRMGGNALAETLVFGKRAGASAAEWARHSPTDASHQLEKAAEPPARKVESGAAADGLVALRAELGRLLWANGGIIRHREGLRWALESIKALQHELIRLTPGRHPLEISRVLGLKSAMTVAGLMLEASLRRQESRGAHFREDFPDTDDSNWRGHLQVRLSHAGYLEWSFTPV